MYLGYFIFSTPVNGDPTFLGSAQKLGVADLWALEIRHADIRSIVDQDIDIDPI